MRVSSTIMHYSIISFMLFSFACLSAPLPHKTLLEIRPQTCVIPNFSKQCDLNVTFAWHSTTSKNICLYQQGQTTAIHCYQSPNTKHTFTLLLSLTDSTTFTLKDAMTQKIISSSALTLMKMSSNQLRRRRKPAWSFL